MLLALVAAAAAARPAAAQACGEVLLSQSFGSYPGAFSPYSKERGLADFPPGRDGDRRTGFIFARGFERSAVGEGVLRSIQPEGAPCALSSRSGCAMAESLMQPSSSDAIA